jgi:FKBP-type peptidyl-prolyl cis-trans isomerase
MTSFSSISRSTARTLPTFLSLVAALAAASCKPHNASTSDAASRDAGASVAPVATGLPPPDDVAAPPADATKSATGLASKVLAAGTGTDHPAINDSVKVDYTGWTTDGKMFDSSVAPKQPGKKPEPATLTLTHVIPGWAEGLQAMVVGEKRRLWVPEELAYAGKPGAPKGMLVFDVELLGITPGPRPPPDVAAAPADAEKTKDGLASKVTQPGTGKVHPEPNDGVKVNYSLWKTDGRLLDESKEKPVARPVMGFFDGWAEGIQLMVVGEKRTLWVPAALSLKPRPGQPPPGDVTVMIELVEIVKGPKTPVDVKAAPKDAIVEKDGLASKVLTKGTGTVHPTKGNTVMVQYAGWTTDGKMFDSSYTRGEPASFGVGSVIPGWTEALQLMVEGEKRRLWIPAELAYKNQPQGPQGMLVFDVELVKISTAPPMPVRPRQMLGAGGPGGGMGGMGGMGRPGMGPGMGRPGMGRPPMGQPPPGQPHP